MHTIFAFYKRLEMWIVQKTKLSISASGWFIIMLVASMKKFTKLFRSKMPQSMYIRLASNATRI